MCWQSAFVAGFLLFQTINTPHATADSVSTIFRPDDVAVQFNQVRAVASVTALDFPQFTHGAHDIAELKFFDVDDMVSGSLASFGQFNYGCR